MKKLCAHSSRNTTATVAKMQVPGPSVHRHGTVSKATTYFRWRACSAELAGALRLRGHVCRP